MKLMKDNKGKVLTVLRADRQKLNILKRYSSGWDLFSFCFPPSLSPSVSVSPPAFSPPPSSSHHSKMLPGPVLVVIVTKGGEILTWLDLPGCWLVRCIDVRKRGGWGGGGDVTCPQVHKWEGSSVRAPVSTHTDTIDVFLRWGWAVVEVLHSQGRFCWLTQVTCWLMFRTCGFCSLDVELDSGFGSAVPTDSSHLWCGCCHWNVLQHSKSEITQVLQDIREHPYAAAWPAGLPLQLLLQGLQGAIYSTAENSQKKTAAYHVYTQ